MYSELYLDERSKNLIFTKGFIDQETELLVRNKQDFKRDHPLRGISSVRFKGRKLFESSNTFRPSPEYQVKLLRTYFKSEIESLYGRAILDDMSIEEIWKKREHILDLRLEGYRTLAGNYLLYELATFKNNYNMTELSNSQVHNFKTSRTSLARFLRPILNNEDYEDLLLELDVNSRKL